MIWAARPVFTARRMCSTSPPAKATHRRVAATLVDIGGLFEAAAEVADFEAYVRELRETYKRRPAFIAALDARGLPGRG